MLRLELVIELATSAVARQNSLLFLLFVIVGRDAVIILTDFGCVLIFHGRFHSSLLVENFTLMVMRLQFVKHSDSYMSSGFADFL